MSWSPHPRWPWLLLAVSLAMPMVLVVHSLVAARELDKMRSIFLRDRAGNIAARLELLPPDQVARNEFDALMENDPAVLAIRAFHPWDQAPADPAVESIRAGRELYHTEERQGVFRAYIPFHSGSQVHIARIDLSLSAPDFILVHARHNVVISLLTGGILLALALYAVWTTRQRLRMESLAQLGTLSAVLAHEIRNPLGAIKGFAQLARESAAEPIWKPLDAIVRESRRLERLVNSLLLYGRPLEPAVRLVEWEPLAAELAEAGQPARFRNDSHLARLRTDPDLLKQALLNLVRNAAEAGASEIRLRAAARKGTVLISIEDDGPGLPEKVRARLFTPFVTAKASGTGLGLSISKKIVETLGGRLRLAPAEPHGTRAEVELYGTHSGD